MDHLFLGPNKLLVVKGIQHIQGTYSDLKAVWGYKVIADYGESKPSEGFLLVVRLVSTVGRDSKPHAMRIYQTLKSDTPILIGIEAFAAFINQKINLELHEK